MPLSAFAALPDDSRLWLMALTRPMNPLELAPELDALMGRWRHKGVHYQGAWALLEHRILAVAEPTMATEPSGCAIDGMLRSVRQIAEKAGTALEDPQMVLARLPDGIAAIPRSEVEARLAHGSLEATTPILDLTLLTLGQLRRGLLERPLALTWLGRKYKVQAPVTAGA